MKKSIILCVVSLLLLLSMLPAFGCQVISVQWEKHYRDGTALVIDGEYEKAIVELNKAIELDPEYAEVYNNSGEIAKAISDYEKCVELSNDPELLETAQMRLDALTE